MKNHFKAIYLSLISAAVPGKSSAVRYDPHGLEPAEDMVYMPRLQV